MRLKYSAYGVEVVLEISAKFNVIIGESGAGKTLLVRVARTVIQAALNDKRGSIPMELIALPLQEISGLISRKAGAIFLIDEGYKAQEFREIVPLLEKSKNYFIFITRDGLSEIPYSVTSTYRVAGNPKRLFMIPAYNDYMLTRDIDRSSTVVEDGGLGYDLLQCICGEDRKVLSARGKSKISTCVEMLSESSIAVFDSCGIGRDFAGLLRLAKEGKCSLFDSRSLEHEILTHAFPKRFQEFTEDKWSQFPSEEVYYVSCLNDVLHEVWGIAYDKTSTVLVDLLEKGIVNVHGRVIHLRDAGGIVRACYPEFRGVSTPAAAQKSTSSPESSKPVGKMSLF